MERSDGGGEISAMRSRISSDSSTAAGEDRLSALPDDILVLVLMRLHTAAAAAQTSVLSRRWRRLWALLPELRFPSSSDPRHIASALLAHQAPLAFLDVATEDAAAESVAAWVPAATRRLSGSLVFTNRTPAANAADEGDAPCERKRGAAFIDLPCFGNATAVSLDVGYLGVVAPLAGVFARLTKLRLAHVHFHSSCALGDAVSSRRCPSLEKLTVRYAMGVTDLAVRSSSLRRMKLENMDSLEKLTVVTPALKHLTVLTCFYRGRRRRPVADIEARQLKVLRWGDLFDRSSVKLGKMKHLQSVCPDVFLVYGYPPNDPCLALLRCFKIIHELCLTLVYLPDINDRPYLLEDMKMLPGVTSLHLGLTSNGHAFGTCLFHILKLCSGTRKLALEISGKSLEEQTTCPADCICDEHQNWKTEELLLNHLQEV
ncbi:hypothetical protein HU200_000433 [Digitaria exilis]|uniref:F-box domain-containing protein n=1 Tax=Digitaria exilis TaxID=1010633 RepID=A0A835G1J5_9POAL|nr:hypothetical protein HU200_000433 [Digitaria exilis]